MPIRQKTALFYDANAARNNQPGGCVATRTTYSGRVISTTDPLNRTEILIHDTLGRTISRINNAGALPGSANRGEVAYTYDPLGRLTTIDVIRENNTSVTTTLTYDTLGRKTSINDPDVGEWRYTYNAAGEPTSQTDAKNQQTTFDYDALGRMTNRHTPDSDTTWTYDNAPGKGAGKIATITHTDNNQPYSETHTYDTLARPIAHTRRIDNTPYTITQEYDPEYGRPIITTYPGPGGAPGFRIENIYTPIGYLKEVRRATTDDANLLSGELSRQLYWQATGYTLNGSIDHMRLGNGLTFSRIISETTGRVKAITTDSTPGGARHIMQQQLHAYDASGQVTRRLDDAAGLDEHYTYDGLNRLTFWHRVQTTGFGLVSSQSSIVG